MADLNGRWIQRAMPIEGIATPAFIHNGPTYFFINLPVYADGLVDAWEMVDLPLFEEKLRSGWVDTQVPDRGELSVHALTALTIDEGRWELSREDLSRRVRSLLKELNPELRNLYDCHGTTAKQVGKVRVSILGISKQVPIRQEDEVPWAKRLRGESASVFFREGGRTYLADLRAFEDGSIELGRLPTTRVLSMDELTLAARDGALCTALGAGERVEIHGLGSFAVRAQHSSAELDEVLKSIADMVDRANGRPDSVRRCIAAYEAYTRAPTEAARESLRDAYESVPEHDRMYVGDMDTKDVAVRMILYGNEEIEGWSHRAVARARGEQLPEMTVPEPRPIRYVQEIRVDLGVVDDWDTFHDTFASRLGFPTFYGRNMDAWIDCMTYLDVPTAAMTTVHVRPGAVLTLELEGVSAFAARCPEQYAALIECAAFVNWRRRERGEPAVLALSFGR